MANQTFQALVNRVKNQQRNEINKTASTKNEMAKVASALNKLSDKELIKVAAEVESMETANSVELIKEADAYGRYVARGYWDRVLEVANKGLGC